MSPWMSNHLAKGDNILIVKVSQFHPGVDLLDINDVVICSIVKANVSVHSAELVGCHLVCLLFLVKNGLYLFEVLSNNERN
jgi:hypothetical protein